MEESSSGLRRDRSPELPWHKSSFSNLNSHCVEVALLPDGGAAVRDTKDRGRGPVLLFNAGEWAAFLQGVHAGEFEQTSSTL